MKDKHVFCFSEFRTFMPGDYGEVTREDKDFVYVLQHGLIENQIVRDAFERHFTYAKNIPNEYCFLKPAERILLIRKSNGVLDNVELYERMRIALENNRMGSPEYHNHEDNNRFISMDIFTTLELFPKGFYPIGFCRDPEYNPDIAYALIMENDDGETIWCHVSIRLFSNWYHLIYGKDA